MRHLGDYAPATVLYFMFTTYRPSTGAAYTLAGTPVVRVYKAGSTTQHTTTYSVTADFDSLTGLNYFTIDTSADGTFYAAGGMFNCVLEAGTVDSVSVVGTVVGSFTLNATAALRPATAGRQLVVDAAGLADANTVKLGPTGSGTAQTARDIGLSVLLSSGTGTGQISLTAGLVTLAGVTHTGAVIPTVSAVTGLTASNLDTTISSRMATYSQPTGFLAATFPGTVASPTNITSATGVTLTATTGLGNQTANITGNLSGSVGSVTGAVGSVTGNVGGSVASIAVGGITAASFAANAIDAASLATTAVDEIRDGVWAKTQTELTGDPGATPTVLQAQMLEYMAIRNKRDTDSGLGTDEIHNSAGSVILTAAITDAAGVFSKAKYA